MINYCFFIIQKKFHHKTLLLSGNELQRMNEGFVYTRFYYSTKFCGKKTYELFRICFGNLLCRERAIQCHMERDFSFKIKSLIVRKYYTGCQHSLVEQTLESEIKITKKLFGMPKRLESIVTRCVKWQWVLREQLISSLKLQSKKKGENVVSCLFYT